MASKAQTSRAEEFGEIAHTVRRFLRVFAPPHALYIGIKHGDSLVKAFDRFVQSVNLRP